MGFSKIANYGELKELADKINMQEIVVMEQYELGSANAWKKELVKQNLAK